ncbi:MAG: hypothetical protein ACI35S_03830 [Anaeroplasma sp.]
MKSYNEIVSQIDSLNISSKDKIKSFITAFLLSLLIISGPLAITINLLMYNNLLKLCVMSIASLFIILVFLCELFYLQGITNGKVDSLKTIIITDSFIVGFVVYTILLVLFFVEVL